MFGLLRILRIKSASFYIGALAGFAAGLAAMLIAFPFLFPPPVLNEAAPPPELLADGEGAKRIAFRFDENAPGRDPIHWANGSGALVALKSGWLLRLEGDFKAGPGPNYWFYLNTRPVGEEVDFLADTGRIRLAQLKSFEGGQNYFLIQTVDGKPLDPSTFHTVTIWCESFSAYIGSAKLEN